ncbi:MAG TPA: hypothetical protein VK021_08090 [Flavobacteriaceae bacterium]|nr:hypothetical protein [Flavobacteriaceae bacterium]
MKFSSKIFKTTIVLFISSLLFIGCSSDDDNMEDPPTMGDNPDFTLLETDIILPTALESNSDPKAQELVSHISMVKQYESYTALTQVPPGAEVSHEPIDPTGSFQRKPFDNSISYTVYTYSYGEATIAYQFSVQNGMNVVEIFYSGFETNGFVKYMELRQSQDDQNGSLKFLGFEDYDYLYQWVWEVNSDDSIDITFNMADDVAKYEMHYNPDMSGTLKIYYENELNLEYSWNVDGSGNWINYITGESGSWSV